MKAKHLRNLSITAIVILSCISFFYLNFSLAPDNPETPTVIEAEQNNSVEEDSVLTELSMLKSVGKKIMEVIIFAI